MVVVLEALVLVVNTMKVMMFMRMTCTNQEATGNNNNNSSNNSNNNVVDASLEQD